MKPGPPLPDQKQHVGEAYVQAIRPGDDGLATARDRPGASRIVMTVLIVIASLFVIALAVMFDISDASDASIRRPSPGNH